ncbi:MAG: beta strand repeat-containing protein [Dolichospermum sp.]
MGNWRPGAGVHRVVLFTDAPAKDRSLKGAVDALAANIGATITSSSRAVGASGTLDSFTFSAIAPNSSEKELFSPGSRDEDPVLPPFEFIDESPTPDTSIANLEIYTIYTGNFGSLDPDLESIASTTGGSSFVAPDPDDLVNTLLTIINLPSITLAVSPESVTEDGTNNLVYTFTRTGATTTALTVNYTIGGTATNGSDYASLPTSIAFAAGLATATVIVDPTADTTVESNETVALTLASGTGYTIGTTTAVTGTINNDDFFQLSINNVTVVEGQDSNATLTVTVNNPNPQQISVNYATAPVNATANVDYTSKTGTLIIPANISTANITIPILNDHLNESDKAFTVTLSNPTNATINPNEASGQVIITDTLQSSINKTLATNVENLTLTGTTAINGTGNAGNNILTGNSTNNTLNGEDGNDTLNGGAGIDTLIGGAGNDIYVVDSTTDVITEVASQGIDTVQSSVTFTLANVANVENLTLTGTTAINGTGNTGNNILTGNGGNNTLNGGDGNDTLNGGAGIDTLNGGAGNDMLYGDVADYGGSTLFNYNGNTYLLSTAGTWQQAQTQAQSLGGNLVTINNQAEQDWLVTTFGGSEQLWIGFTDEVTEGEFKWVSGETSTYTNWNIGEPNNSYLGQLPENYVHMNWGSSVKWNDIIPGLSYRGIIETITGNDTLNSGAGNDTLDGGGGIDALIGGTGNDIYIVDSRTDIIVENANEGTDTIQSSVTFSIAANTNFENLTLTGTAAINGTGNVAHNVITGNSGNNTLNGGAGNDTLDGGAGTDTLIGGLGSDTYIVDDTNDIITEKSSVGIDAIQSSVTYTIAPNVENLTLRGTAAINGIGNAANNTITGNAGNNTLDGGVGNDTLIGGLGDDIYIVDSITDIVTELTSRGTDTIQSSVTLTLAANFENLTLTGTAAINGTGNAVSNVITGNSGNNTLNGGAGNDTLDGGAGNDNLIGGVGDDIYIVDSVTDIVTELTSGGTDTIQSTSVTLTLATNVENLTLIGTAAIEGTGNAVSNVLTGNGADNTLDGGAGNDTLNGGEGVDDLIGGLGDDIYFVDDSSDSITENAAAGTDTVNSTADYDLSENIENLILTGTAAINGTGNTANNTITGNAADNVLDGDAGIDTLIGGLGSDTYFVDNSSDSITENANEGMDTAYTTINYTAPANIENLNLIGTAADGTGNAGNNIITGNEINNTLNGGAGIDTLIGGDGNDIYVVDSTTDIITEELEEGADTIQSSVTFTLATAPNVENLTLTGAAAINGTGNAGNNVITGNSAINTLDGGAGIDTLIGGLGNDIYIVDSTTDTITENASAGTDTIQSSVTYTIAALANVENLTLTGTAAINGTGNEGNNVITGNGANNILNGGAGNDILTGGFGKDTLTGGLGADRFDYRTLADSVFSNFDVITGFNATTGNDLFLVSTARNGFSNAGSVTALNTDGIAAKLTNTVFTANSAAQFTFGTGTNIRTFVAINDATAGFSATTDAIIEVTGLTGTLGLSNFTTTLA